MLTAKQVSQAKDALAAQGVSAWHVADADAPPVMRSFARCIEALGNYIEPYDEPAITSMAWSLSAGAASFAIEKYGCAGLPPYLVLHPTVAWRAFGWSEDDFDFERMDDTFIASSLKDEHDDADVAGNAPHCVEVLDSPVVMREFAVSIKSIHPARDTAAMKRLLPSLHDDQQGACADCLCRLRIDQAHVDHIVPFAWGGEETAANLRAVCPDCNSRRGHAKKEMICAWMHGAGLWDAGWTPDGFEVPAPDKAAAWDAAKPLAVPNALAGGPVPNPVAKRAMGRRIAEEQHRMAKLRTEHEGAEFVPFAERKHVWDNWPDLIEADPARYAGMDDYDFLAALGEPISCNCDIGCPPQCERNDPRRRNRLRARLHRILGELEWRFGRYDGELDEQGQPTSTPRRYVPPGCDLDKTMGEGFHLRLIRMARLPWS